MNQLPEQDRQELVDTAIAEYLEAIDNQLPFDQQQWLARYAVVRAELLDFVASEQEFGSALKAKQRQADGEADITVDMAERAGDSITRRSTPQESTRSQIGQYALRRLLGAGGMGQVYEAVDASGNMVAVKLLSQRWMRSEDSLLRFKQEGKIASAINHPRCVFVRAADEDQGQPYIVMELMTGRTLKDLSLEAGQLSVTTAVQAIMDVLDGLEEAHSHGMIHRDIKPANCYLESNGRVKLGDFGLARSMAGDSELTRTGDFIGTPLFASPEQVKGLTVDQRTDIYSVCATLYYLLTGKAPFAGSSPTSVIAKIVSEDPVPIRELNPRVPILLERVVMRGLHRDPKSRFQSVRELRQALEPFATGRQAIAVWGRRFAAYGFDSILSGIVSGAMVAPFLSFEGSYQDLPFSLYLGLLLPVWIYYLLCEGWGNATLGKWMLRLQVVSQRTGEKPPRWQLVWRTTIALLLMGIASDLLLYAIRPKLDAAGWITLQWSGYLLCYAVMVSPLVIARKSRRLLHDWMSGTMVVDRPANSAQQQLAVIAANYHIPLLASTGYPNRLGDFVVHGLICASETGAVLEGSDERLGRQVWLCLRPRDAAELTSARRNCDRTTRLRWLSSGFEGEWRWDAFLAYKGAPLKHWTTPDSPLEWKNARGILRQLAQELACCQQDSTCVQVQSLDQIWIDSRGRLVVVDWSPADGTILVPQADLHVGDQNRAVLREAARLILCGISRPLQAPPTAISSIVPVHVREMLNSLTTSDDRVARQFSAAKFFEALESTAGKPTEAGFQNRMLGLGIALFPCSLLLGSVAALSRIGNQLILDKLADQMVAAAAVDWLSQPGNEADLAKASSLVESFPNRLELTQWLDDRQQRDARLIEQYRIRFAGMGAFSQAIASGARLTEKLDAELNNVRFEWAQNELMAVNWRKESNQQRVDLQLVARIVRQPTDTSPMTLVRRSPGTLWGLVLSPFLMWIIWAGLTRGGLSMALSGLRVVDSTGRQISRLAWLLRSLVAGLPFLALQTLITCIDLNYPSYLELSKFAYQIMLWLFLVYAILIIAFPRRAPHDLLLGMHLVPR